MTHFDHLELPAIEVRRNFVTRYPHGLTIWEALVSWVSQVDAVITNVNDWNARLDEFIAQFDTNLQAEVTEVLEAWRIAGLLQTGAPTETKVYSDFSTAPDGAATTLDSGTPVLNFGNSPLVVTDGLLGHTSYLGGMSSAGYMEASLPSRVTRLGGEFVIPVGGEGEFALVAPKETWSTEQFLNAGVHAVFSPTYWRFDVRINGALTMLKTGLFAVPLAADGVTKHRIEISIDHEKSTAHIYMPDGTLQTVTDSRISANCSARALWEMYEENPGWPNVVKTPLKAARIWASHELADGGYNRNLATQADLHRLIRVVQKNMGDQTLQGGLFYLCPEEESNYIAPASEAIVDPQIKVTGTPSTSGQLLVEVEAWVQNTVATSVYLWGLKVDSGEILNIKRVFQGAEMSNFRQHWVLSGLTPNVPVDITLAHFATVPGPMIKVSRPFGCSLLMTAKSI